MTRDGKSKQIEALLEDGNKSLNKLMEKCRNQELELKQSDTKRVRIALKLLEDELAKG